MHSSPSNWCLVARSWEACKILWNFKDCDVPESMRQHKLFTLDQDYKYIITYTREDLKEELIEVAGDSVPRRSLHDLLHAD